jgi:hypothetical protein
MAILLLWEFTKKMWAYCNALAHGESPEETRTHWLQQLQQLQQLVQEQYETYSCNPDMILLQHSHLFTTKPLEDRLKTSYDNLQCWLHSVQEAVQVKEFQETILQSESLHYFPTLYSSSNDYTYYPSETKGSDDLSLTI